MAHVGLALGLGEKIAGDQVRPVVGHARDREARERGTGAAVFGQGQQIRGGRPTDRGGRRRNRRVERAGERGAERRIRAARHRSRHPPGGVGEVRPLVRRARAHHLACEGQRRPVQAIHAGLVEIVRHQAPGDVQIAIAAVEGVRLWRGQG